MPHFEFIWTARNKQHLADNDLTPADAEAAMTAPEETFRSRRSGRPGVKGRAVDGRRIVVIYDHYDELRVYVVTAYVIDRE